MPRRLAIFAIIIFAATLAAYLPAINAGYIWDDDDHITDNPVLHQPDGLKQIWTRLGATPQYYPLVFSSFRLEYKLWNLNPTGYHLVNIILHATSALLIYIILLKLKIPGSMLAAVIFAIHPVHVESVAWITERKNVLSLLFYLLALYSYLKFNPFDNHTDKPINTRRVIHYITILLLFLAALLSKTVTATLPAAILLIIWYKTGRIKPKHILHTLPMFVMAMAFGLITVWMEINHVGAQGRDWQLSILQRIVIAGNALWFYIYKLLLPIKLTFIYPKWNINPPVWWHLLLPAAFISLIAVLWTYRNQITRGPVTAVAFFAGTLIPALGFFDVFPFRYAYVADHFQYHASIGVITLFAAAATLLCRHLKINITVCYTAAVIMLATLAAKTYLQTTHYKNEQILWQHTIAANPSAWMAMNNLGELYYRNGQFDLALEQFNDCLNINTSDHIAHNNIGMAYMATHDWHSALKHFQHAIDLHPGYINAYNNRGNAYLQLGQYENAINDYDAIIAKVPDYIQAYYNRGLTYLSLNQYTKAIHNLSKVIELSPGMVDAYRQRAVAYTNAGQYQNAINDYNALIDLTATKVAEWFYLRANTYQKTGNHRVAIKDYTKAIELDPNLAGAYHNRGYAYSNSGMFELAINDYNTFINMQPNNPNAYYNRAVAYYHLKQYENAWDDINQLERLGAQPNPLFIQQLKNAPQ